MSENMSATQHTSETEKHWYVFSVSYKKELEVRNELACLGINAYVPMHFRLHTVRGRKVRRQEPAIYGLVFAYGDKKELLDFRETSLLKAYMFLKSHRMIDGSLQYIVIRDDDMENFRKLSEVEGAKLTYYKPDELRLAKGEKVKIMDGPFAGITGIVQKLPHKNGQYLVVSLPDVAIAAVNIKPEFIQPLTQKIAKSTDIEKDSKRLASLAIGLITSEDESDNFYVEDEMEQIEEALQGCKTFLPNDRANFYFAFYAAALAKGKPTDEYKEELIKVLPRLKANNLLRPTAHLLFYKESGDGNELQAANSIINKWDAYKFTDSQKQVLKLRRLLTAHLATTDANSK